MLRGRSVFRNQRSVKCEARISISVPGQDSLVVHSEIFWIREILLTKRRPVE
jgi:hypothetical protein